MQFTPLNASLIEVLLAAKEKGLNKEIRFPEVKVGMMLGPNKDAYCRFHRLKGQHTDDCRVLAEEIEKLIRKGKLTKFVDRKDEKDKSEEDIAPPK